MTDLLNVSSDEQIADEIGWQKYSTKVIQLYIDYIYSGPNSFKHLNLKFNDYFELYKLAHDLECTPLQLIMKYYIQSSKTL